MTNLELHKKLVDLLNTNSQYTIAPDYIEIVSYDSNVASKIGELGLSSEKIGLDTIRILTSSADITIFENIEQFNHITEIDNASNILILENEPISFIKGVTYNNLEITTSDFIFSNAKAYLEFQVFLKEQEIGTDESFHFVDSYNLDFRKLVFVSLAEKGRLSISYNQGIPNLDRTHNYSEDLLTFKNCFSESTKILPKFLKSALINSASNYPQEKRFHDIFIHQKEIVYKAKQNFEVYLNNLSIDKIKKEYDELKTKYFKDLSDILGKLTNKIIVLPLGISATLLAIDRIDEIPFFLYFLMFAILITSIYLSLLLKVNFSDIVYIKRIFNSDYAVLIQNSFFSKYPNEKDLFEEIKSRITNRISFLELITQSYFWILNLSNVVIIGYILNALKMKATGVFICCIGLLIVVTLFRNYIVEKSSSAEQ